MEHVKSHLPWWLRCLSCILPLILLVGVLELILNLAPADLYYKNQFFPVNRDIDFPQVYKKDSKLFWRFRENITTPSEKFSYLTYRINDQGLRGPHIPEIKTGTRILALGNSCTFGWGVSYTDTWVKQLEDHLNSQMPGGNFEVICGGVPGYSSYQGKIFFEEKLLKFKPDIVLIMFGWNDHFAAGKGITDSEQKMASGFILTLQNLFSKMKTYQCLRKLILSLSEKKENVRLDDIRCVRRVPPDEFRDNLKEIINIAVRNNVEPILLIPPIADLKNYFKETASNLHTIHRTYQNQIKLVSRQTGVSVIDLQEAFDNHNDLFDDAYGDPTHFNARGHRVVAEEISRELAPTLVSK